MLYKQKREISDTVHVQEGLTKDSVPVDWSYIVCVSAFSHLKTKKRYCFHPTSFKIAILLNKTKFI